MTEHTAVVATTDSPGGSVAAKPTRSSHSAPTDEITMLLVTVDSLLAEGDERRHLLAATAVLLTLEPTPSELEALEEAVYAEHEVDLRDLRVAGPPRQPGVDEDEPANVAMTESLARVRDRRLEVIQLAAEAMGYEAARRSE